jgi:hypothetical protein
MVSTHHTDERAVDETLREVESSTLFAVGSQGFQDALEAALADPPLIAPLAGLVGRLVVWQVCPLACEESSWRSSLERRQPRGIYEMGCSRYSRI